MFDIIGLANTLFGCAASSCKEILLEFNCEYKIQKRNLPLKDNLIEFLGLKPERDKIEITVISDSETAYIGDDVVWAEKYEKFVQGLYEGDDLIVSIKARKVIEEGRISIYNLNSFTGFLCGLNPEQIFENFTRLFSDCGDHIFFQLLDKKGLLRTNSIAFSDSEVHLTSCCPREKLLKDCQDASVFLDRTRVRVIPQDFEINDLEGDGFDEIKDLFGKLQTILSYIYLANTAAIIKGKVLLQFNPLDKGYEYEWEHLTSNEIVPQIYDWVFREDSCVDKATIARKIISTYCRDRESLLTIDEKILNSIKSDYVIYQKNHVDQYIDMKNKISEYIVNSAEKIQDLSHKLIDAFRNNFVAVIVFLMTVLLTDSIDFSQFLMKEISPKVVAVCGVFTVATLLYYVATVIMVEQKWDWLNQSYKDLKKNYKGVFEDRDIEEAFNYDEPLNNAEKQYRSIFSKINLLWVALIIILALFTFAIFWYGNHIVMEALPATENTTELTLVVDETTELTIEEPISNTADVPLEIGTPRNDTERPFRY